MSFPERAKATVVITTKNRKDSLRRALGSALMQVPTVDVLVIDDGSSDGTAEMVKREFPGIRLDRWEQSRGLIVQRNHGATLATTPFIVSIDDDAEFSSPSTIGQTLAEFDHPKIGAVAIPFINVNQSDAVLSRTPVPGGPAYVADTYIGTAHALRRELFLEMGAYRAQLFHQGEEPDFCIRLLDAGYVTRLGNADPILHYESPIRSNRRVFVHMARNNVLFAWHNVPMPHLFIHLPATTVLSLRYGFRTGHPAWTLEGIVKGYAAALREVSNRKPVSRDTYKLFRRLRKQGPLPLSAVADELPS